MATVYQHNSEGYYVGEDEDFGGPLPHNCVKAKPTIKPGLIPRWNGNEWKQEQNHVGEKGFVSGEPVEIKEYGPLPEGFSAEKQDMRTFGEKKANRIAEVNGKTSELILAGFDCQVGEETYRFGYGIEDQANLTAAAVAATLSLVKGEEYSHVLRGWRDDAPHSLTFDARGLTDLAQYAETNHKQALLAGGRELTDALRAAGTEAELDAVVDDRG